MDRSIYRRSKTESLNWETWSISRRFMKFLHKLVGGESFDVEKAYSAYKVYPYRIKDFDEWSAMNVRNNLAASTERGLLERINRGVYKFAIDELP